MQTTPVSEIDSTTAGLVLARFLYTTAETHPSLPFDGLAAELGSLLTENQHQLLQATGLTAERALAATLAPLLDLGAADWNPESREVQVSPRGLALLRAVTTDGILARIEARIALEGRNGDKSGLGAAETPAAS